MNPTTFTPKTTNEMAVKLTTLDQERQDLSWRIDTINAGLRETVQPEVDIAELKLKAIKDLLATPKQDRDFLEAEICFQMGLKMLIETHIARCQASLNTATVYSVKTKHFVPLTEQEKRERFDSLSSLIKTKTHGVKLAATATTNLDLLKNNTENEYKRYLSTCELLNQNKLAIIAQLLKITTQQEQIEVDRERLFQGPSKNIWEAGERGDIQFIQLGIDDCWFWEKKNFINQQNQEGQTALSLACVNEHFDCVKLLLNNGADPNVADALGYRPLHWAAKKGALEIGKKLVEYDATIDCQGEYERTPLHMAAYNNHDQFVAFLLKQGANINAQTDAEIGSLSALHKAVMQGHILIVKELVNNPKLNVNLLDSKGRAALHYATTIGRFDISTLIISHLSWKRPKSSANPNHPLQLSTITPMRNTDQMRKFFEK